MPGRETEGNLFERVRAEKRAAPIVGNESKVWVGAGLSPATYELRVKGQGPRAKARAWFWDLMVWDLLCTRWHGPSNDQNSEHGNADMEKLCR